MIGHDSLHWCISVYVCMYESEHVYLYVCVCTFWNAHAHTQIVEALREKSVKNEARPSKHKLTLNKLLLKFPKIEVGTHTHARVRL